jgi:hypothetical protein
MSDAPKSGDFCWYELTTSNVQAAKDFYGKVFGWEFSDHDMGEMTYTMITIKGKQAAGIWAVPKDLEHQMPPHWMAYILVDDIEASVQKAEKEGAEIKKPIQNAGDFGRFAIIADPAGAHIALWQTLKK